jgi:predicted nucleotidyltransferase
MSIAPDIQSIADRIARTFRPDKIILFGSHARGQAAKDSDVDLLVLMDYQGHAIRQSAAIRASLGDAPFSLDVIVRTPEEFSKRCAMNDWLMREIQSEGIVLHAA